MKIVLLLIISIATTLYADALKISADSVEGNELEGISYLRGNVRMSRAEDELNASKIIIYTNRKREPMKYRAEGNVTFKIVLENGALYKGRSNIVEFDPKKDEYRFYEGVRLEQLDEKKSMIGEKIIVNIKNGRAYAEGAKNRPVTMIFDIKERNSTKRIEK